MLSQSTKRAFTLVELLVVILIIAILIAVAVPAFLGQRTKAQDRGAQSTLRSAITAARSYGSTSDSFKVTAPATIDTALTAVEKNIKFQTTAPDEAVNDNAVGVSVSADRSKVLTMVTYGGNEMCWGVQLHLDAEADKYFNFPMASNGTCTVPAAGGLPTGVTGENKFPARA